MRDYRALDAEDWNKMVYSVPLQIVLLRNGYQICGQKLDARQFGSLQARKRWFLLLAQHGYTLPELLEQTHMTPQVKHMCSGRDGENEK